MSRLIGIFLLFCLSPILVIVWIVIFFSMGRPIFFQQQRIGLGCQSFIVYKFRTMTVGKITFLGKLLRVTGIDELPQLINIIKKEMSFIGPRPLTQYDIDRLGWNGIRYNERWSVRPGLSGLAQLSKKCHPKNSMFFDLYYARHKHFCLDLKIFFYSMAVPLLGKDIVKTLFYTRRK